MPVEAMSLLGTLLESEQGGDPRLAVNVRVPKPGMVIVSVFEHFGLPKYVQASAMGWPSV